MPLPNKEAAGHAHNHLAPKVHTHAYASPYHGHPELEVDVSGLAPLVHTHPYADAVHTHAGYAAAVHTHDTYAPIVHTHNYADPAHTHLGYAAAVHTHDYAASSHTHTLQDADIPATIARDSEVTTAVSNHAAAADPHPGYLTAAEGNAAYATTGHTHAYAAVGHTHAGPIIVRKTADQSNNSGTVLADVSDLSFSVAASTSYVFEFNLFVVAAATTTGLVVAVNGPLLPTHVRYGTYAPTAATAFFAAGATAYDTSLVTTGVPSTTVPHLVVVTGVLENGINAGTFTLRMRSEVNGSNATIQRGSWGRLQVA